MYQFLTQQLDKRKQQGNCRELKDLRGRIDFASNDYLGFARCEKFKDSLITNWKEHPYPFFGATGSRLLTGHRHFIDELEASIADFHGAETGLLFNSGYDANLGLISTVAQPKDILFYDAHIHASTHEGMRLSKAHQVPWRHNDVQHLEKRLKSIKKTNDRIFVLVESLYSCDGSLAPLLEICSLCEQYHALVIIDEAHATGIIGKNGEGLVVHHQCQNRVFARIHTFSKALGGYGAVILGSKILKDFLINFCRPLIYATALPLPVLIGIQQAYLRLPQSNVTRTLLQNLIQNFKTQALAADLSLIPSETPIQANIVPGNFQVRSLANYLQSNGFDARPLLSPTVKQGTERLRLCLHAFNTAQEVETLISLIRNFK